MRFCRGQTGDTNCGSTVAVSRKMHQYFLVVLYISLEFAAFGSGPDAKHSRASALWFILSTTMVFVVVQSHLPRKNTHFHLDWAGIEVMMSHEKRSVLKLTCFAVVIRCGTTNSHSGYLWIGWSGFNCQRGKQNLSFFIPFTTWLHQKCKKQMCRKVKFTSNKITNPLIATKINSSTVDIRAIPSAILLPRRNTM